MAHMTLRLSLTALGAMGATMAMAADFGLRGPIVQAPPPVMVGEAPYPAIGLDWGGFYIGGMVGYGSSGGTLDRALNGLNDVINSTNISGQNVALFSNANSVTASGIGFGAFIGYQIPFEDTVLGIEGDYYRAGLRGTAVTVAGPYYSTKKQTFDQTQTLTRTLDDIFSLRLRAGWTPGSMMFYVTGGGALARGSFSGSMTGKYNNMAGTPFNEFTFDEKVTAFGLAYGFGMEALLTRNVAARAEYMGYSFSDFGGSKLNVHTLRAGVSYRFNGPSSVYATQPVMMPAPAPMMPAPLITKG